MSILLSANQLSKSYGVRPLFQDLTLVIESSERVGLIGPNGSGKSTLLKILVGNVSADSGEVAVGRGITLGYLEQTPKLDPEATVGQVVISGTRDPLDGDCIASAQEFMALLSLSGPTVNADTPVGKLSGGWQKRVALARELARRPDLLLLDEPTNHLDLQSIMWLENWLARASIASLVVTHDRLFLQRTANRIIELDRRNPGGMLNVRGNYSDYVESKAELVRTQEQEETKLRNKLRREVEWLRRGPKARTTKQEARIARAGDLQKNVDELAFRNQSRTAQLDFSSSEKKPKRLIEAKGIGKAFGNHRLFWDLDLWIGPTSRVGLLGANGSGKSTLIRCLLAETELDKGEIIRSDNLSISYFEQNRDSLNPDLTLISSLVPRGDQVIYRGKPIHVKSYLGKFLFRAEQMEMKVGKLSGGEQSRLLIAQLMLRPANVLVLDEPTNDLDLPTLEVLEDCLTEFDGAVLLVTHDRYFLDQVATEILAFDTNPNRDGEIISFAGVAQWESWQSSRVELASAPKITSEVPKSASKKKLGYKEQRELDGMEKRIEQTDAELAKLTAEAEAPANLSNASKLADLYRAIAEKQAELDGLYRRWEELESIKS